MDTEKQIALPIASQMQPQIPRSELPVKNFVVAWTLDSDLTSETHGKGAKEKRSGVGGTARPVYTATSASEAKDIFEADAKRLHCEPFILAVYEAT